MVRNCLADLRRAGGQRWRDCAPGRRMTAHPGAKVCVVLLCCLSSAGCKQPSRLEQIREEGLLRVVTRQGPLSYYPARDGEKGLEYQLAALFAARLSVRLELVIAGDAADVISRLDKGEADLAAASLTRAVYPDVQLDYGPAYQWVSKQVAYRRGHRRPASLDTLESPALLLSADLMDEITQERFPARYPAIAWTVGKDSFHLLGRLHNGEIRQALVRSDELRYSRTRYPEARAAFDLTAPRPLGWAVPHSPGDTSLIQEIRMFFREISENGQLDRLLEQVYGNTDVFDYVDARKFIDRYHRRLAGLKFLFRDAAAEFGFDWRLLAAVSYQESHWDEQALSPTGVRGLMMLTRSTAEQLGVSNRTDPAQSVHGGAKYLAGMIGKLPDRIAEPDRTWLALAAYNVGFGHLEDARIITQKNGGHPDVWEDVRESLPRLSKMKWYKNTRHGYARGYEAVQFVENIRRYHTTLVRLTEPDFESAPLPRPAMDRVVDSPVF